MNETKDEHTSTQHRCGYVALVGAPNAGKSTFMNTVLGTKISIVTPKPQTTRRRILGVYSADAVQIIFMDTPGLIEPRYVLQESMVNSAIKAIREADVCIVLLDAERSSLHRPLFPEGLLDLFRQSGRPVLAVLNKIDLVHDKSNLLPLMDAIRTMYPFKAIIPISALTGDAMDTVLNEVESLLPFGPPLYPQDELSDQPERFFVSEIIREKIFEQFRQEVPYATEVYITEFSEDEGKDYIAAEIVVERESQRRILIGAKGQSIRNIGIAARTDIEEFLGRPVYLDLHVRIRDRWRDDRNWVRRLGYTD